MIWILNIHWGYFLISKVCQWFYQLDHVTFSKNVSWSVNFALPFSQIFCIRKSTIIVDISTKKCTNCKKFQEKSCDYIHDVILWPHLSNDFLNVSAKIFHNSMYKRVMTSCACVDASDFKPRGVKKFLLYIWLEYQI